MRLAREPLDPIGPEHAAGDSDTAAQLLNEKTGPNRFSGLRDPIGPGNFSRDAVLEALKSSALRENSKGGI